jgi:hypothetical protein
MLLDCVCVKAKDEIKSSRRKTERTAKKKERIRDDLQQFLKAANSTSCGVPQERAAALRLQEANHKVHKRRTKHTMRIVIAPVTAPGFL